MTFRHILRNPVSVAVLVFALFGMPNNGQASSILFTDTGNAAENAALSAFLSSDGDIVTMGPQYTAFTNAVNLAGINAVLLLPNYNWPAGDMPLTGQTALNTFVNAGGGLVTSEWLVWKIAAQADFQTLQSIIPVVPTITFDNATPITYTRATADAILDDGLGASFTFVPDNISGSETFFAPRAGATVYYGSSYGAGVIGWGVGSGRVLSFSTLIGTIELSDANYRQLVDNAVDWTASQTEVPPAGVPEPMSLTLLGTGLIGLMARRVRQRTPLK